MRDGHCIGPAIQTGEHTNRSLRGSEDDYRKEGKDDSETKVRNQEGCPVVTASSFNFLRLYIPYTIVRDVTLTLPNGQTFTGADKMAPNRPLVALSHLLCKHLLNTSQWQTLTSGLGILLRIAQQVLGFIGDQSQE